MAELAEYRAQMAEVLAALADRIEKEELPRLKDAFRAFHTAFYSIYSLLLKRKLIREDPYKGEAKIIGIEVPETENFPETEQADQMGLRLANFDNQLDFIVNFYQFTLDNFGLDQLKRILGLIKYIDWVRFAPNVDVNTGNMVDLVNQARTQCDQFSLNVLGDSLVTLRKSTGMLLGLLKKISDYDREAFKAEIREKVTASMPPETPPTLQAIRKKYAAAAPGRPFYNELAEEVILEDYDRGGAVLREKILKQFSASAEKPKESKPQPQILYKPFLIEGLFALGSVSTMLSDIISKLDENAEILENSRKTFFQQVKKLFQQMMNKVPDAQIFDIEYVDPNRQIRVEEKLNFTAFHAELEKKAKALFNISTKGISASKLEKMEESQLLGVLEKNLRDIQTIHKLLGAVDEYFKASVDKENRSKIRGIKPELSTMKNALIKANQKRYDYNAQKEEEEQFKKLGITS
jgi:hypothetical protein